MADEYIRREDAKDALQEKVFHNLTDEFYGAMQTIDELPSADVAPRVHAHWEWDENAIEHWELDENAPDWNIGAWVCSECGMNYADVEVATRHDINVNVWACSNFCGHCGAIMDEEVQ